MSTCSYDSKKATSLKIAKSGSETEDYPGFFTKPFTGADTIDKFRRLPAGIVSRQEQDRIIETVSNLEQNKSVQNLVKLID